MMLHWLQKTAKPIALMGGGTSKIGDPSGRDTSRSLLTNAQIDANIASIRTVFRAFLIEQGRDHGEQRRLADRLATSRSCARSAATSPSSRCSPSIIVLRMTASSR